MKRRFPFDMVPTTFFSQRGTLGRVLVKAESHRTVFYVLLYAHHSVPATMTITVTDKPPSAIFMARASPLRLAKDWRLNQARLFQLASRLVHRYVCPPLHSCHQVLLDRSIYPSFANFKYLRS